MSSVILHISGAETESGQGDSSTVYNELIGLFINVTAVDNSMGDALLNITLQQSPNGTDWYDGGGINITSIDSVGLYDITPAEGQLISDMVRVIWTISGTDPSFTFEVTVETEQ